MAVFETVVRGKTRIFTRGRGGSCASAFLSLAEPTFVFCLFLHLGNGDVRFNYHSYSGSYGKRWLEFRSCEIVRREERPWFPLLLSSPTRASCRQSPLLAARAATTLLPSKKTSTNPTQPHIHKPRESLLHLAHLPLPNPHPGPPHRDPNRLRHPRHRIKNTIKQHRDLRSSSAFVPRAQRERKELTSPMNKFPITPRRVMVSQISVLTISSISLLA